MNSIKDWEKAMGLCFGVLRIGWLRLKFASWLGFRYEWICNADIILQATFKQTLTEEFYFWFIDDSDSFCEQRCPVGKEWCGKCRFLRIDNEKETIN